MSNDWLSARRDDQIGMAKNWGLVLTLKAAEWNIPDPEVQELNRMAGAAEAVLTKAKSAERTKVITAQCRTAFEELLSKMRFFKTRYFLCPPLTPADLVSLGLKLHDHVHTPVQDPTSQAEADIAYPNRAALELTGIRRLGEPSADHRSEYKVQIRFGVLADYGPYGISSPPKSGDDLPYILTTRRKRELFNLSGYSGKTAYFCLRWLNPNDKPGPYGPIISAIIP
jgi:hypothetical protein